MKKNEKFNPLMFLASLGAGGISVMPFAFFQYTHHTGKGLIAYSQMGHGSLPPMKELLFHSLEAVMAVFAALHLVMTVLLVMKLVNWIKSDSYRDFVEDPLRSGGLMAPFISIAMTFNVFIGPIRFFFPAMSQNLQSLMLPAFIGWAIVWAAVLRMEIKLLGISFSKSFDVSKINFGWLLHPFALGMVTVTGTGIAAMSKTVGIAHAAAFMSLISGTMGFFLLTVKIIAIFKSHFNAPGLPDKQFLPSLLIVVPNITLFAISGFRFAHYLERKFQLHTHGLAMGIVIVAFAFEVWYMLFGVSLLRDYFKKHFFNKEFHVSQWGLICPLVAIGVLGSFFYKLFVPNPVGYGFVLVVIGVAAVFFSMLLVKQIKCAHLVGSNPNHDCSELGLAKGAARA